MIIVIPTEHHRGLDDKVASHFGRCQTYTFLNKKGEVIEIIENTTEHTGGKGLPPELMKEHGAEVLLCKELGPRAISLCEKLGINVYISKVEKVKDIFNMWQDNKLKKAGLGEACSTHAL